MIPTRFLQDWLKPQVLNFPSHSSQPLQFGNRRPPGSPEVEKRLIDNGINGQKLAEEFGVKLWLIRGNPRQRQLLVTIVPTRQSVEEKRTLDLNALQALFAKALGTMPDYDQVAVNVGRSEDPCCRGACPPCVLSPYAPNHDTWEKRSDK